MNSNISNFLDVILYDVLSRVLTFSVVAYLILLCYILTIIASDGIAIFFFSFFILFLRVKSIGGKLYHMRVAMDVYILQ